VPQDFKELKVPHQEQQGFKELKDLKVLKERLVQQLVLLVRHLPEHKGQKEPYKVLQVDREQPDLPELQVHKVEQVLSLVHKDLQDF
jgi:hypothetical protein